MTSRPVSYCGSWVSPPRPARTGGPASARRAAVGSRTLRCSSRSSRCAASTSSPRPTARRGCGWSCATRACGSGASGCSGSCASSTTPWPRPVVHDQDRARVLARHDVRHLRRGRTRPGPPHPRLAQPTPHPSRTRRAIPPTSTRTPTIAPSTTTPTGNEDSGQAGEAHATWSPNSATPTSPAAPATPWTTCKPSPG